MGFSVYDMNKMWRGGKMVISEWDFLRPISGRREKSIYEHVEI